jgi:hypothetical protein
MTVVSSKEFVTNQKRYFDLALSEQVCIKRGKNMFLISVANNGHPTNCNEAFEPDEDFYNSISMEEVRTRLHGVIDKLYANR